MRRDHVIDINDPDPPKAKSDFWMWCMIIVGGVVLLVAGIWFFGFMPGTNARKTRIRKSRSSYIPPNPIVDEDSPLIHQVAAGAGVLGIGWWGYNRMNKPSSFTESLLSYGSEGCVVDSIFSNSAVVAVVAAVAAGVGYLGWIWYGTYTSVGDDMMSARLFLPSSFDDNSVERVREGLRL